MSSWALAERAAHLVWRTKALWVFGAFAVLLAVDDWKFKVPETLAELGVALGWRALLLVGEAAVIDGARKAALQQPVRVVAGLRVGLHRLLRSAVVRVVSTTALVLAGAVMGLPVALALFSVVPPWVAALSLLLAVVCLPCGLTAYLIGTYAQLLVVVDDLGAVDALRRGVAFLRGRLRSSLRLLVIAEVADLSLGFFATTLLVPALLIGALAGSTALVLALLAMMVPYSVLSSAVGAFRATFWTLALLDARELARE